MNDSPRAQIERHIKRHEERIAAMPPRMLNGDRARLEGKVEGLKLALACLPDGPAERSLSDEEAAKGARMIYGPDFTPEHVETVRKDHDTYVRARDGQ